MTLFSTKMTCQKVLPITTADFQAKAVSNTTRSVVVLVYSGKAPTFGGVDYCQHMDDVETELEKPEHSADKLSFDLYAANIDVDGMGWQNKFNITSAPLVRIYKKTANPKVAKAPHDIYGVSTANVSDVLTTLKTVLANI
ncbi:MAG: hypothetical protein AB3X41_09515 [Leptothrix ochracea]|uniref:hypothetical protein n=1 Tax=Leptothrix ochracea TaxID=735331 RepID=UPI0034E27E40